MDPLQRLQDNVNRMQWKKCTFSGNGNNRFNISLSFLLHLLLCLLIFFIFLSSVSPLSVAIILPFLLSFSLSPPPLGDGDYICAGSHRQHELYIWGPMSACPLYGDGSSSGPVAHRSRESQSPNR